MEICALIGIIHLLAGEYTDNRRWPRPDPGIRVAVFSIRPTHIDPGFGNGVITKIMTVAPPITTPTPSRVILLSLLQSCRAIPHRSDRKGESWGNRRPPDLRGQRVQRHPFLQDHHPPSRRPGTGQPTIPDDDPPGPLYAGILFLLHF